VNDEHGSLDDGSDGEQAPRRRRRPADPAKTLNTALLVYILINLFFALPLVVDPERFFDVIGLTAVESAATGGLRWFGAMLLAWAVSGLFVLARPVGRGIFVTTGALQLTFGSVALVYSWIGGEPDWSTQYHALMVVISTGGAIYLWWARFRSRAVLRHEPAA
jgi:hypothetical protein